MKPKVSARIGAIMQYNNAHNEADGLLNPQGQTNGIANADTVKQLLYLGYNPGESDSDVSGLGTSLRTADYGSTAEKPDGFFIADTVSDIAKWMNAQGHSVQ